MTKKEIIKYFSTKIHMIKIQIKCTEYNRLTDTSP